MEKQSGLSFFTLNPLPMQKTLLSKHFCPVLQRNLPQEAENDGANCVAQPWRNCWTWAEHQTFVLEPVTSYTEIAWINSGISYLVQRTQIPKDVCWLYCARLLCKRHIGYLCELMQVYPSRYCQRPVSITSRNIAMGYCIRTEADELLERCSIV